MKRLSRLVICWSIVIVTISVVTTTNAQEGAPSQQASASEIAVGYTGAIHNADIVTEGEIDRYTFKAEANHTYVIETFDVQKTTSPSGTDLVLYSGETKLASGKDGTGNADQRLIYTVTKAGTYQLRVGSDPYIKWAGTYSLRVLPKYDQTGAAWDAAADAEPNDTCAVATELAVGLGGAQGHLIHGRNTAYLTHAADYDAYRFTAEANRTYVVELFNVQKTASVAGAELYLTTIDGETRLEDDRNGREGTGETHARIIYTFPTAGTYCIGVTSGVASNWAGAYAIRVLPKYDEPGAAWDVTSAEPNDTWALATGLQVGPAYAQTQRIQPSNAAYVTHTSDEDWYRFDADAGAQYVIETFNVERQGTVGAGIWLYGENKRIALADDRNAAKGKGNVQARMTYIIPSAGAYFIKVAGEGYSGWSGAYSVRVCRENCKTDVFVPLMRK
jgi:hypothetical protein